MSQTYEPSTSKTAKLITLSSNAENIDIEMDDMGDNEDSSFLWCIEDTLFYAQGLKHHSAGKEKSVYIAWNENYLLNFVFKTSSKTGTTTLTKVKISIPVHEQQQEEISNMLILEMNTLLYMKSGRVYYFSSVKTMHKVDWLTGIRCAACCPLTQFSVIRLVCSSEHGVHDQSRILSLEVYKDIPQLGKYSSNDVLRHSYNITFDLENLFNCDWIDETYTLLSLITDERNLTFLKQLVSIGNIFRPQEEMIALDINQEVHIFTISGNIFILVGATICEGQSTSSNPQVEGFNIRLLNTYACNIECVRINCDNNLLIVLLQSGHMDIWYKSKRMFGALFHCQHDVPDILDYHYWPTRNIFYFTTPEDVIQLKIIIRSSIGVEKECIVKETRKCIGGMMACTFVEELQQLVCLSINNIFYRINFTSLTENVEQTNENETKYENLTNLYTLNLNRINDLRAKAKIVNELMEQPKYLHNAIEREFQKQQVLALESKTEIFKKLFQCHLEYHIHFPGIEYFDNDCVHIKATSHQSQQLEAHTTIFCLIFMSLKNYKNNFLSSVFTATMWYLHISNREQSFQMYVPYEILGKKLCFIINIPLQQNLKLSLSKFSLSLITFFNHRHHPICLKFNLNLDTNVETYVHLFSYNIQNLQIFRNSYNDVKRLLNQQQSTPKPYANNAVKCSENLYKLKQRYKIPKTVLQYVMKKLKARSSWSLGMDFKIYYLHQYLIELNYEDSKEILLISSNYPMAIFYFKLLLTHAMQYCNDVDITDTSIHIMQQMIMNYQNDIEHLYGSLTSLESDELNSNSSMLIEILRNIYSKLRIEFYDIAR